MLESKKILKGDQLEEVSGGISEIEKIQFKFDDRTICDMYTPLVSQLPSRLNQSCNTCANLSEVQGMSADGRSSVSRSCKVIPTGFRKT